jgi:galactose mutarotase-like enzyme
MIAIRSADLSAEINPLGAQLSALRDSAGRNLLWDGDSKWWAGRAPVLFPIVGTLAGGTYLYGSKRYALARHGFARGKPFETVVSAPTTAMFKLRADDSTLAVYPFDFELEMRFALDGPTLTVTATVRNTGLQELPASLGFHPGFRWPLPYDKPRGGHFIEFETDEPAPARRINADGLLSPEEFPTPIAHRRLALADALFEKDVVIFDRIASRAVRYGAPGGPHIAIRFPDAHYLGVWTRPGAPFVCIEPWQGVTDPANFSGDIRDKPGIFTVAPGAAHALSMAITLQMPAFQTVR